MSNKLSEEQNDAVQEFLTTFNKIEAALKHRMKRDSKDRFTDVLREARLFVGTSDFELLTSVAELRNVLVHGPRKPYDYVAVQGRLDRDRSIIRAQRRFHVASRARAFWCTGHRSGGHSSPSQSRQM
jgi:hypothetical protein